MYYTENHLAKIVFECGLEIHENLGSGLLESAYEECLFYELLQHNLNVKKQQALPLVYKEIILEAGYRVDLIVENKLIVEVKSCESMNDVHLAQVLTYLRLSGCKLGLLINFNSYLLKDGIKRIINGNID